VRRSVRLSLWMRGTLNWVSFWIRVRILLLTRPVTSPFPPPYNRPRLFALSLALIGSLLVISAAANAQHASLNRETLQKLLPVGLLAGELDTLLPVRPVFERVDAKLVLRGYAFETINFEPARGYSGKPINLLVTLASDGTFLGVHLLSHHEPIFTDTRGTKLLAEFARQYEGLTFRHNTQIVGAKEPSQRNANSANLSGISTGTVSARAIDRSIVQAAIQVARQRFDTQTQTQTTAPRQSLDERYQKMTWDELMSAQWIQSLQLNNAQLEARFTGTPAANLENESNHIPQDLAISVWLAPLSQPQVGRNLLDDKGWAYVRSIVESGQQVWLALELGRLTLGNSEPLRVQPGAVAQARVKMLLLQAGRAFELREIDFDYQLRLPPALAQATSPPRVRLFRTVDAQEVAVNQSNSQALDPNAAMQTSLSTYRRYGNDALQRVRADWTLSYPQRTASFGENSGQTLGASAARATATQSSNDGAWWQAWQERGRELMVLALALVVLCFALARPLWLSAKAQRLRWFRVLFLLFTLIYIGWYAQAQLSIVNLSSTVEALRRNEDLFFLLYDPLTVCLWGFVVLSLVIWGRGTFCGWLCPFGALQELLSLIARAVGVNGVRLTQQLDRRLKTLKYVILAGMLACAVTLSPWTDQAVEIEPFKTAINMGFERAWPFVFWAGACALSSVFVFRGYCRYICPLGAALAVLDSVRLLSWIPRRAECGTPCQTCRHRCEYQAIKPTGKIDYRECFQCQDCVTIYQDPRQCLPLVRMHRKPQSKATIPI
jgi:NosR/NirI family transcriptional regulator, nitrous oxide reductase regulator